MSDTLNPADFGLTDVRNRRYKQLRRCHNCEDEFRSVRWSPYFCPDCDIKRMARLTESFKKIEEQMKSNERPRGE